MFPAGYFCSCDSREIIIFRARSGQGMNGEAWSCFAHLPAGLIDPKSVSLTLNWIKPRPTRAGFQLTRDEIDEKAYLRNLRVQRLTMFAGGFLVAGISLALLADLALDLKLFASELNVFAAIWAGTTSVLVAVFIYVLCGLPIMRFRRAEPRRLAFHSASVEFEQVDAWRRGRCVASFWSDLDATAFELECAELLAGYLSTGQVMLTRSTDDYGVDVLACSPLGRIIAQCKHRRGGRIGAAHVRELAGSKAFFGADLGVLVSLEPPVDDVQQCNDFARAQRLELWDLARIVAVAQQLRDGNGNGIRTNAKH